LTLQCSLFQRVNSKDKQPIVIYLHGNSGCRLDSFPAIEALLPMCDVFCFDFSGCGQSEGEYISLGFWEKFDIETVIDYIRSLDKYTRIGLWGRSMGAATAIFFINMHPSAITSVVLDSSFSTLRNVADNLVEKSKYKIPNFLVGVGLSVIRKSILERAKFDINELTPVKYVSNVFIPALFVHGKDDKFILPSHCEDLKKNYGGDNNCILVEGGHNDARPQHCLDSISIFFQNTLFDGNNPAEEIYRSDPEDNIFVPLGTPLHKDEEFEQINKFLVSKEEEYDEDLKKAIEESLKIEKKE